MHTRPKPRIGLVMFDGNLRLAYVNEQARRLLTGLDPPAHQTATAARLSLHVVHVAARVRDRWPEFSQQGSLREVHVHTYLRTHGHAYRLTARGLPHHSQQLSRCAILVQIVAQARPSNR